MPEPPLIPFAKGWQYKNYLLEGVLEREARAKELSIATSGWLLSLILITTDLYGSLSITPMSPQRGPELTANPQLLKDLGAFAQDPAGWAQKFYQPNPQSTFGYFVIILNSSGFQGFLTPFQNPAQTKIYLPKESTQASAYVSALATAIETTDDSLFLKSIGEIPKTEDVLIEVKQLENYLRQGWMFVSQLTNGKIVVRHYK